ncbi:MAG: RnfH family protein [Gammaproteobacteria bacterium]|nr:RnfH family protein [Gammaproteobacteria bacterium]
MSLLDVEVVYARRESQTVLAVRVPPGTTALTAVRRSGMLQHHPELAADTLELGVFGNAVALDYAVQQGDRVEIYRPLQVDPVTRRKRQAQAQRG